MNSKPFIAAGVMLGIGLGGFLDGIIFHQIFQLHSMLSARLPQDTLVNVKTSMVWDGLFHLFTWMATAIGLGMLWHAGRMNDRVWSGGVLVAALFMGWGIFNGVEGIIDHLVLNIHHVVERLGRSMYDYIYVATGIVFPLAARSVIRKELHHSSGLPKSR